MSILFFLFVISLVAVIFLFLFLGHIWLLRPDFFLSSIFPEKEPDRAIFFSKEKEDGDFLILYYGFRVFLVCVFYLFVFWIFRAVTN